VVGHVAKGIVYLLVGGLAVLSSAGKGGKVSGEEGAVRSIGEQPFGRFLLIGAGLGLLCYAVWRLFQAVFNPEKKRGVAGAGLRIGRLIGGLTHGALAVTAFQLGLGQVAASHQKESRLWVGNVLSAPFGEALIAIVGLALCGFAIYQLYCAAASHFPERFDAAAGSRRWVTAVARIGLTARGVVFGIIGARLVQAGFADSSRHTRDIGGALRDVASQPHGRLLLGLVAAGLAAYGVYQLVVARFGRTPGT